MTHDEIMALPIEDISERDHVNESITIRFKIHGIFFHFHISKVETGPFFPNGVYHSNTSQPCSFCDGNPKEIDRCEALSTHRYTLFQRLIHAQPLRLHWLYREYLSADSQLSTLPIKNIEKYKKSDKELYIYFTLNNHHYRLHATLESDGFAVYSLYHYNNRNDCPLCKKNSMYCSVLSPHKQAFFQHLLEE